MRVERIRPFLEQNKEYLPLITTINIVPPNLDSPHVLCIPQAKQLPGEPTDVLDVLDMLDNDMALRAVREATTPQKMAFFADLERQVEEMGGRKGRSQDGGCFQEGGGAESRRADSLDFQADAGCDPVPADCWVSPRVDADVGVRGSLTGGCALPLSPQEWHVLSVLDVLQWHGYQSCNGESKESPEGLYGWVQACRQRSEEDECPC